MNWTLAGEPPTFVSVPTHFFKVVLAEDRAAEAGEDKTAVGAFVMPNAAIAPETPLTAFSVPLQQLETLSGHFSHCELICDRTTPGDSCALGKHKNIQQLTTHLSILGFCFSHLVLREKLMGERFPVSSKGKMARMKHAI